MDGHVVKTVADVISTITILSCLFMKIPQIIYIRQKQSAEGIYLEAMLMEIIGFTIVTLYNYTNHYGLMTYLEYPIILFQIYVMLFYTLKFKKMLSSPVVPLSVMSYVTTFFLFAIGYLPKEILSYLIPLCTPLSGFAKVTYMYGIIKAANADTVSATTWIISIVTNISRLFTVYVDSADKKLMINFIISSILSSGVLTTALYYQQQSTLKSSRRRKSCCHKHHVCDHKHSCNHEHND